MTTIEIKGLMDKLRLKGMSAKFQDLLETGHKFDDQDAFSFLGTLLEAEDIHKDQRSLELLLKNARLKRHILPAEVQCSAAYGLSKEKWIHLCECNFLENKTGLVVTGKTGVGKSFITQALCYQACAQRKSTLFYKMSRLNEDIRNAKLQGTYLKLIRQLTKVSLLVIDDFGLTPLSEEILVCLYDIMEERNYTTSTIFTSQLPFHSWYDLFYENLNIGEAFLDRLQGCSEKIELTGESRRKKKSQPK